jgi:hypothetical protein
MDFMKKQDAIKIFGSSYKLAKALGITRIAVAKWKGEIPKLREYQINDIVSKKKIGTQTFSLQIS